MKNSSFLPIRRKKNYIYNDKIQKSSYLNHVNLLAEYHRNYLNNLNNVYINYQINSNRNDKVTENNLRNIGFQRIVEIKRKLRKSFQMLKDFDDKYIFNRIQVKTKKNNSEINLLNNFNDIEENKSLNISNIIKTPKKENEKKEEIEKNEEKEDNNPINNHFDIIMSNLKRQEELKNKNQKNINSYSSRTQSAIVSRQNSYNKYLLLTKDIENNSNRMKKIDKLSNLYKQINAFMKKDLKILKKDKNRRFYSSYREKIDKKRPKSTNNKNKHILWISKNQINKSQSCTRFSSNFNRTNATTTNNNFNRSNKNNTCDLNHNFSNISNIITNRRKKRKINSSIPSSHSQSNLKKFRKSPFLFSTKNKIKLNLSQKTSETNKEIDSIASQTINKANKIKYEINKNYSSHKEPKFEIKKNNLSELLTDNKIDLYKIRKDLKLKDSNGLFGEINEIEIVEKDLKNMSKRLLSKKRLNILTPIARGIIHEDLLLNKDLIYNVGIENRRNRTKFFKLYDILNKIKVQKRKIRRKFHNKLD